VIWNKLGEYTEEVLFWKAKEENISKSSSLV
jgi:hypothetical protein